MPSVFMSHCSKDKNFARKLTNRLKEDCIKVWLDEAELNVGDSLLGKIGDAINSTDFLIVVLSNDSIKSTWVQNELKVALNREFEENRVVVLPILIEQVEIPPFLRDKLYADFIKQEDFENSYIKLRMTILGSAISSSLNKVNELTRNKSGCLYDNEQDVYYCSVCYDERKKLIGVDCIDTGESICPICKNSGIWNKELWEESQKQMYDFCNEMNDLLI